MPGRSVIVAFKSTDFKGHFVPCLKTINNMNIKFYYLYRDGANYKNFNEIIFSNPNDLKLNLIEEIIRKHLIDGQWFVSKEWNVPDLHFREFSWDSEIDLDWHEFERVEETLDTVTQENSIEDFLQLISVTSFV
jgi:hypothetical protein